MHKPVNDPRGEAIRRARANAERVVAYRTGAAERLAAAEAKRARKAAKRVNDAHNTELGQMQAGERVRGRTW
ncbi:hypothetical protein [Bradyrhizobium sp. SZCCHNR3015]|uniref:hypothetical protein n=1 Tax=Bradyrhizobium sp. SZCCHNR3015 TaxID=3057395 RepID=UPI002915D54E|nr:hypothetical protein [Bradyrhizobium sp. SZCCHNR3015]